MSVVSAMPSRAQVTVVEDRSMPDGGYALIRITGVTGGTASDTGFWLRRIGYDRNNLGPNGWQGPECRLQPVDVVASTGGVDLLVGPEIVDAIEIGTPIEIAVPTLGVKAKLIWPEITPSVRALGNQRGSRVDFGERRIPDPDATMSATAARARNGIAEADDRTVAAPSPPPPPPEPEPEHQVEESTVLFGKRPGLAVPEERTRHAGVIDRTAARPSPTGSSAGLLIALALVLLVAIGGTAAYWFYGDTLLSMLPWPVETPNPRTPPQPETPPPPGHTAELPPAQPEPPRQPPAPPETPQPQTPPPESPPQTPPANPPGSGGALPPMAISGPVPRGPLTSPVDFARGLLQSNPSPDRAFELAQFYLGQGDNDVALLLLEHAADGRNGPAMTAIGRMYDPLQFARNRSAFDRPNPARAADYYRRAQDAGDPSARQALDALRAWLNQRANSGDPDAQRALREAFP